MRDTIDRTKLVHDWPLNVRGLASVLTVAAALAGGQRIKREHLRGAIPSKPPVDPAVLAPDHQRRAGELVALLREHRGNVSKIARALGKSRTHVHRWLNQLQIDPASYRGQSKFS